jgi:rhamnogalacturonan endolyase
MVKRRRSRHLPLRIPRYFEALEERTLFSFGVTTTSTSYVVDTGAQVVFTISRTNADLTSIKYNGNELTAPFSVTSRYSHYESGLSSTATTVTATTGTGWIKITATDSSLGVTQYYIARSGFNNIYMATYAASLPSPGEMRFITYLDRTKFTNHNVNSDINGMTAIEGSDVYENTSTGHTASKFYSGKPFIDDPYHGDTGSGVGVFMMTPNRESSSGGPFFQDIDEQGAAGIELYNYMYSGHTQTEAFRPGLQGPYALAVTNGSQPGAIDYSFLDSVGLQGWVTASGRGTVVGKVIGVPNTQRVVVGLANATAQYWGIANSSTMNFSIGGVKPGTYTATIYYNELPVGTESVTVTAGTTVSHNMHGALNLPAALWTIGTWDGTPAGFLNASKIPTEYPSDSRMSSWGPVTYTVGSSSVGSFPALQWKTGVNNPTKINFTLSGTPSGTYTLRIGLTITQFGARPVVTVNPGQSFQWVSPTPAIPNEPDSRGITRGTTRGNEVIFTYSIPASALRSGTNTIQIDVASGSSGTTYLSPGWAYDAIDLTAGVVGAAAVAAPAVRTQSMTTAAPETTANGASGASVGTVTAAVQQTAAPAATVGVPSYTLLAPAATDKGVALLG